MPNIIIKDENGNPETYEGVNTVKFKTPDDTVVSFKYNSGEDYQRIDPLQFCVRFIDYDGFVLREVWVDEGDGISEFPPSPSHEGLQFVEWNYTLAELSNITRDYDVGACYKGDPVTQNTEHTSYFFATVPAVTRNFGLRLYGTGANTFTVDWGDGSTSTITRTTQAATTASSSSHTYAVEYAQQEVTIKLTKTGGAGTYWFGYSATGGSYTSYRVLSTDASRYTVHDVILAEDLSIRRAAFYGCNLKTIVIPKNTLSNADGIFQHCNYLKCIIIPRGVTAVGEFFAGYSVARESALEYVSIPETLESIGGYCFAYNYHLSKFCLPHGITSIPRCALSRCLFLKSLILPNSLISIEASAFTIMPAVDSVIIPATVENIGDNAFSGVRKIIFRGSVPPVLANVSNSLGSFGAARANFIYVPDPVAYKAAPSWENYAPYVVQG